MDGCEEDPRSHSNLAKVASLGKVVPRRDVIMIANPTFVAKSANEAAPRGWATIR
jgi:hypothetical protein